MNKARFPAFASSVADFLKSCVDKRIAVIGHVRPDGDCIGSQVALTRILNRAGARAEAYNEDPIPRALTSFVANTPFFTGNVSADESFDCIVTVDCSAIDRMGNTYRNFFKTPDLCIDHHVSNIGFAEQNWIDAKAAATAEIIAGVAQDAGIALDAVTAQALFIGLATDTGQFRYEATTERVFDLSSWLLSQGANAHLASYQLYERDSLERIRLLQQFLSTLNYDLDGAFAWGFISQKMFEQTQTHREDAEGFIDYPRSIDSVKIAMLLEEQPDGSVKGSLRSKFPQYRVDLLAQSFGGGGHACAAGFHADETLENFPTTIRDAVARHLKSII